MAVNDELEAILARLQRMRDALRLDVAASGESPAQNGFANVNDTIADENGIADGTARHDEA